MFVLDSAFCLTLGVSKEDAYGAQEDATSAVASGSRVADNVSAVVAAETDVECPAEPDSLLAKPKAVAAREAHSTSGEFGWVGASSKAQSDL